MAHTTIAFRITSLLLSLTSLGVTSGCLDADAAATQQGQDLVGGTTSGAEQFPSTMLIRYNCTVSKVGPRHILTAAHCVQERGGTGIKASFLPGASLQVSDLRSLERGGGSADAYRWVTVESTTMNPDWLVGLEPDEVQVLDWPHPPDVAVVVLDQASAEVIADIPEATVDLTRVADGDGVWIMGYGCESGVQGEDPYPTGDKRLKVHRTVAQGWSVLDHPGANIHADSQGPVYAGYVITPGQAQVSSGASLCPGDSGGPVVRADGEYRHIVGVNAYYSFLPYDEDPARISYTNWHTRLSETEPWWVGTWLQDLGVNVAHAGATKGGEGD